ncbi:hypothetical protein J14TS2_16330 [Bacillus sp. J14TS2]|uniref:hypothetical protein n=1 Tax=Bacillus sp. J14TS2 TaxID=2807188 RepID=UPI001B2B7D90|nr:hypothetical protein [Bacillus sp. J14TS2]GIN71158.1 hypothetical protein J14TS2_16330 [Bacillus sp. J14TS2]
MSESFRLYKVVETEGMSAEQLQKVLNNATDGFPEMQIDHVVGTKLILGYESMLNAKGRAEAALRKGLNAKVNNTIQGGLANG